MHNASCERTPQVCGKVNCFRGKGRLALSSDRPQQRANLVGTATSTDKADTEGDAIDGGAGDDGIQADSIIKSGYLRSTDAANNGDDFADGGEGDDQITGGGGADNLFGGVGDDKIFGDSSGKSDSDFFVTLAYQGADYIDGEDGNDYIEGGGKQRKEARANAIYLVAVCVFYSRPASRLDAKSRIARNDPAFRSAA